MGPLVHGECMGIITYGPMDSWTMDPIRLPIDDSLDLHAFTPADIPSVVDEYLRVAHQAGLRDVRLIHGRGVGVQRVRVQQVLREHPLVVSFADAPESHLGATVAHLVERHPE
jgi:DNA-nicking Smr family endonuclease